MSVSSPSIRGSRNGTTTTLTVSVPAGKVTTLVSPIKSAPLLAVPLSARNTLNSKLVSPLRVKVNSPVSGPNSAASLSVASTSTRVGSVTVTVTSSKTLTWPSSATSRKTYSPVCEKAMVLVRLWTLVMVTAAGPLIRLQVLLRTPGGLGLPSSVASPASTKAVVICTTTLLPAFTTGP